MYYRTMINLFLLPFKGIIWLILGVVCSLPWLVVLGPVTVKYWGPKVLSIWVEHKTQFPCRIGSLDFNWTSGDVVLTDVTISNPAEFYSSDFLKFKKIGINLSYTSLFQKTILIHNLDLECKQIVSVDQHVNNLSTLMGPLSSESDTKRCLIQSLKFSFSGFVGIRSYSGHIVQSVEFFRSKTMSFSNVYWGLSDDFAYKFSDGSYSLEKVYQSLRTLFTPPQYSYQDTKKER